MTTIATDGKTMAADTQMTGAYIDRTNAVKISFSSDMKLVCGATGSAQDVEDFKRVIGGMTENEFPARIKFGHEYKDFEALIMSEGDVFWVGEAGVPVRVGAPASVGSGEKFAMGAMMSGKTPKEAVEIAMLLDPHTGGDVIEVEG